MHTRPIRGGRITIIEVVISDGTGRCAFHISISPGLRTVSSRASDCRLWQVDQYLGRLVMNSPDWEPVEIENLHTERIVPIYPLTERITQKWLRGMMNQVVTLLGARGGGCAA